jgi:hypothetical protein
MIGLLLDLCHCIETERRLRIRDCKEPQAREWLAGVLIDDGLRDHLLYSFTKQETLSGEERFESFRHWTELNRSLLIGLRK